MLILWRKKAELDLDEAFDYLLERNPGAARATRNAIFDGIGLLAEQPGLGRPGRVAGTRELVIGRTSYIVGYTVDARADLVIILRVLHGARRWPAQL